MDRHEAHDRTLDELVAAVGHQRPHLVDVWDTIAVLETLGYSDARARTLGVSDVHALGSLVFERLSERPIVGPTHETTGDAAVRDGGNGGVTGVPLMFALGWLVVLIAESRPSASRLGPQLRFALIPSLVLCGGFVEAMRRRASFYTAIGEARVGRVSTWYFARLGALATLAASVVGVLAGWLLHVAPWPSLILWVDEFAAMCAVWLLTGAALSGGFTRAPREATPLPRMTVVAYHALPFVVYGALYFCFTFAAPLVLVAASPYGVPPDLAHAVDLGVLALLLSEVVVEYADRHYARAVGRAAEGSVLSGADVFRGASIRAYVRASALVMCGFVAAAALVDGTGMWVQRAQWDSAAFAPIATAALGYLLIALSTLNARVLFRIRMPWIAVRAMIPGLVVCLGAAYAAAATGHVAAVADALVCGGTLLFVQSTLAVRRAAARPDRLMALS